MLDTMGRPLLSGLLALALGVQSLGAFAGAKAQGCACAEALCCRLAKKPAPMACHHSEPGPSASVRCHHPAEQFRLPITVAVMPAPVTPAPLWHSALVAAVDVTRPHEGFPRLDSPPPRPSRAC